MPEARLHPRREVSIETRLFLPGLLRGEPGTILPCRIVDVSKSGARVFVEARYRLPHRIFILRGQDENSYECRTVWQNGQTAGLQFTELCSRAKHQELLREIKAAEVVEAEPTGDSA